MRAIISISAMCLLLASCGDPAEPTTSLPPATGATTSTTTTVAPPSTTQPPTTATPTTAVTTTTLAPSAAAQALAAAAPPWRGPELPGSAAPPVLVEQWNAAENRTRCSALFPEDLSLQEGAQIRSANFAGGWAVAWDRAAGPGRFASGEYCADCGRGAFGVAGTGVDAAGNETARWPLQFGFEDGSLLGYGYEGDADPGSGAPYLMYLLVDGEGCLYNVWSFLGEDHLLELTAELRFVSGLRGEPTLWASQIPPPEVRAMGEPPWDQPALPVEDIDRTYLVEWEGEANAPASCPLLAFADLGDAASGAQIRRAANEGEMLVAWDRPSGPGHDGASNPCEDCGRGAVGLGTFQDFDLGNRPVTHEWSDGSRAAAAPGFYGTEAHLQVAGFDCVYWVWSHLGPDHLDYLFSQLRRVEGMP